MAKDTFLNPKRTLNARGRLIDLSTPKVMGILNITPDSFYSGSRIQSTDHALFNAEAFLNEGATFLDIGAYSSRPGATDIGETEELRRLIPIIAAIREKFPEALLSIDTFRARVAYEGIKAGAHLVNDISGGTLDDEMFKTVAALKAPYILMHMRGNPQTMQQETQYKDLVLDITTYFSERVARLTASGVHDIILDPGFGFAKTPDQNYQLMQHLEDFHIFGLPLLTGISRKGMIYRLLETTPEEALNGTTVLHTIALSKGSSILRVHDVKAARQCITLTEKLKQSD